MAIDLEYFRDNFFGYNKESFPVEFLETKKIKSCDSCNGTGRISHDELTDYHKREYDTFHNDCLVCKGEGRVIITTIRVSMGDIPYKAGRAANLRSVLFDEISKPYSKEEAEGIEDYSQRKIFRFGIKSVKE